MSPNPSTDQLISSEICYSCDRPAIDRDHVPARGFFPAPKDTGTLLRNLRKDLLVVPACLEHNQLYTDDEEYVIYVISMFVKNHSILQDIQLAKYLRATDKAPGKRGFFERKKKRVYWVRHGSQLVAVVPNSIDLKRFERVMDKIARGLYYVINDQKRKLSSTVNLKIVSPDMSTNIGEMPYGQLTNMIDSRFRWENIQVSNPEVFQCFYYFHNGDVEHFIFELLFYQGFRVWIFPKG